MTNVFFTADTHFGHSRVIKFCNRPFVDIEEHDEALIQNWNSLVTRDDIVYHLGDLGLCHSAYLAKILNRLNGSIHIILGNHDKTAIQISKTANVKRFASISDSKYIRIENQHIFLLHYAMRTWRASYHGSWHLFGHSHGRMPEFGKSFDVGVDCWDYKPVSFDCVKQKMDKMDLIPFGDEVVSDKEADRLKQIALEGI